MFKMQYSYDRPKILGMLTQMEITWSERRTWPGLQR